MKREEKRRFYIIIAVAFYLLLVLYASVSRTHNLGYAVRESESDTGGASLLQQVLSIFQPQSSDVAQPETHEEATLPAVSPVSKLPSEEFIQVPRGQLCAPGCSCITQLGNYNQMPAWANNADSLKHFYYNDAETTEQNGARLESEIETQLMPGDHLIVHSGVLGRSNNNRFVILNRLDVHSQGQATFNNPVVIEADPGIRQIIIEQPSNNQNTINIDGNIANNEYTDYIAIKNFEIAGGDVGIRVAKGSNIWLHNNKIHGSDSNGIRVNDPVSYDNIWITSNEIYDINSNQQPPDVGSGIYLGVENGAFRVAHANILFNKIHDVLTYGIQLKTNSFDNVIAYNDITRSGWPGIIVYGNDGSCQQNIVDSNMLYNVGTRNENGIQAQGGAIIANNVVIKSGYSGILSKNHVGQPTNIQIIHNTVINSAQPAIALQDWNSGTDMVLANNAVYNCRTNDCSSTNTAVSFSNSQNAAVAGNVQVGGVIGYTGPGFMQGNNIQADFVDVSIDGSRRDVHVKTGSALIGAAASSWIPPRGIYKIARRSPLESGASDYRHDLSLAAPTGLTATIASPSVLELTWADNADVETGYRIERREQGSASFALLHTSLGLPADLTSFVDGYGTTGVMPGRTYEYRVYATIDDEVNSAPSNAISVTLPPSRPLPNIHFSFGEPKIVTSWEDLELVPGIFVGFPDSTPSILPNDNLANPQYLYADYLRVRNPLSNNPSLDRTPLLPNIWPTGLPSPESYDTCGDWIMPAYALDQLTGNIYAFIHYEGTYYFNNVPYACKYSGGPLDRGSIRQTIGYAVSRDGGTIWQQGSEIITSPFPIREVEETVGTAQPAALVENNEIYLFYFENGQLGHLRPPFESVYNFFGAAVAKAPLSSNGLPGSWRKFYQGGFTEAGLGGRFTSILPGWDHVFSVGKNNLFAAFGTPYYEMSSFNGRAVIRFSDALTSWDQSSFIPLTTPQIPARWPTGYEIAPAKGFEGLYIYETAATSAKAHLFSMYKDLGLPSSPKGFSKRLLIYRPVEIRVASSYFPSTYPLVRYYSASRTDAYDTTQIAVFPGDVRPSLSDYARQVVLGNVFTEQVPGIGMIELTSCYNMNNQDFYTVTSRDCGSDLVVEYIGFIFTARPSQYQTQPLYNCESNNDKFLSHDASCPNAQLLGYIFEESTISPSINWITPAIPADQDATLEIEGANFLPAPTQTRVFIDGFQYSGSIIVTPTKITVAVPAGTFAIGTHRVRVENPGQGNPSNDVQFRALPASAVPIVDQINPAAVSNRQSAIVNVYGNNFQNPQVQLLYNGAPYTLAPYTIQSNNQIDVTIPTTMSPGTARFEVERNDPQYGAIRSGRVYLGVVGAPTLLQLSPNLVYNNVERVVTLTGTNFVMPDPRVQSPPSALLVSVFGRWFPYTAVGTVSVNSPTEISFFVPRSLPPGTYPMAVQNFVLTQAPSEFFSNRLDFTIRQPGSQPAPIIVSLNPSTVPEQSPIDLEILGSDFITNPLPTVLVDGNPFRPSSATATRIIVSLPGFPQGSHSIQVQNADGRTSNVVTLIVTALTTPVINSITPDVVTNLNPTTVIIRGNNFQTPQPVTLFVDGAPSAWGLAIVSNTEARVIIPTSENPRTVMVRFARGQTSSNEKPLTIISKPIILSVFPQVIIPSMQPQQFTIIGENFVPPNNPRHSTVPQSELFLGPGRYLLGSVAVQSATEIAFNSPVNPPFGIYPFTIRNSVDGTTFPLELQADFSIFVVPPGCGNGVLEPGEECETGLPCQAGTCNQCLCVLPQPPSGGGGGGGGSRGGGATVGLSYFLNFDMNDTFMLTLPGSTLIKIKYNDKIYSLRADDIDRLRVVFKVLPRYKRLEAHQFETHRLLLDDDAGPDIELKVLDISKTVKATIKLTRITKFSQRYLGPKKQSAQNVNRAPVQPLPAPETPQLESGAPIDEPVRDAAYYLASTLSFTVIFLILVIIVYIVVKRRD